MSKKSYMSLLKEAIAEFDTSDTVEVKGPMLDPILSWDGDGELPVYKDAASILERYYFNEDAEEQVHTLDEAEYENDNGKPANGPSMKHTKGAGTEQAGTDEKGMDKGEEEIAKEAEELSEEEWDDKDVPEANEYNNEDVEMENTIIEKLIAEMEEDLDEADVMSYTGDGPKETMPKEKKAKGPEEDAEGAGTEQAGTGTDAGQVPDRKDMHDQMVKPKNYNENEEIEEVLAALEEELEMGDEDLVYEDEDLVYEDEDLVYEQDEEEMDDDDEGEDEEDLDVDAKVKKEGASAVPGGPSPHRRGEDWDSDEAAYSEAFEIFKEAIEDEDE
jgi:hypothetical protein